jgi:SAM-dependent methyltransferase
MQELKDISEYWDSVAAKCLPNGKIRDNWDKRREILRRLLKYTFEGVEILEIGCGLGITAAGVRINTADFRYIATDTSPQFVERIKRFLGHDGYIAKASELPFEENRFNAIFLFDTLEHIHPDERQRSYEEIRRVLKDKFLVFINNPLTESFHNPEYDHGFRSKDLLEMCKVLNAEILEVEEYSIKKYRYQFITLIANGIPKDETGRD